VQIGQGVARNSDLQVRSPLLRVAGSGSADLVRERIDYVLQVSVVGTLTGQGGKELSGLRGVTVPIKVGGTFDQPTYAVDLERLVTESAKGQLRKKIEEQLDAPLRKRLEGLFR
jgi:AsmA protein